MDVAGVSSLVDEPFLTERGSSLADRTPRRVQREVDVNWQEGRELVRQLRSTLFTVRRLMDDFLDLSRIESGLSLSMAGTDFPGCVKDACQDFAHFVAQHQLRVMLNLTSDKLPTSAYPGRMSLVVPRGKIAVSESGLVPPLLADRVRIGQAVRNFFSNALKFSARGAEVVVDMRTVPPEEADELLLFADAQAEPTAFSRVSPHLRRVAVELGFEPVGAIPEAEDITVEEVHAILERRHAASKIAGDATPRCQPTCPRDRSAQYAPSASAASAAETAARSGAVFHAHSRRTAPREPASDSSSLGGGSLRDAVPAAGSVLDLLDPDALLHDARVATARPTVTTVVVRVMDRAGGIAPDDAVRLFRPYEQAAEGRQSRYRGAGLGLAIARYIAARHGGFAWLEWSRVGAGSCFTLLFPLERVASVAVDDSPLSPGPANDLDDDDELNGPAWVADGTDDTQPMGPRTAPAARAPTNEARPVSTPDSEPLLRTLATERDPLASTAGGLAASAASPGLRAGLRGTGAGGSPTDGGRSVVGGSGRAPRSRATMSNNASQQPLRGRRILVVDDAEIITVSFQSILRSAGATVVAVEDGRDAVAYLLGCPVEEVCVEWSMLPTPVRHPVDAIVTDSSMRFLHGPEFVRLLRASGVTVPILGMTGEVESESSRFRSAGLDALLTKPCDSTDLVATIAALLRGSSTPASAAPATVVRVR